MRSFIGVLVVLFTIISCGSDPKPEPKKEVVAPEPPPPPPKQYGFQFEDYLIEKDTIKSGDVFGTLMANNNVAYQKVLTVAQVSRYLQCQTYQNW